MKTMSADYSCDIGQTYVDDVIPEFVPKMDKYIDMVLINDQIISEFHDKDRELEEDTGYKNKKKGGKVVNALGKVKEKKKEETKTNAPSKQSQVVPLKGPESDCDSEYDFT